MYKLHEDIVSGEVQTQSHKANIGLYKSTQHSLALHVTLCSIRYSKRYANILSMITIQRPVVYGQMWCHLNGPADLNLHATAVEDLWP